MKKRTKRLSKEEYKKLKEFKLIIRKEIIGKLFKDHAGHIYKVDENGSIRRQSIEVALTESTRESGPGIQKPINS
jgi:hypothetical protein